MNSLIKVLPNVKKYNDYIYELKKGINPIMLSGLTDVGKVHMAYSTNFYVEKPICIVTYNELQARKIINDLKYFNDNVEFFPKREVISFEYLTESKDTLYRRISTLNNIVSGKSKIIVTTIEAAMQKMISMDKLYENVLSLKVGQTIELEALKDKISKLGFERTDLIEGYGQFSVRGGIVDIAITSKSGIRIEFWGDEIDSIRQFSISSQRTVEMLNEIEINPAFEFVLDAPLNKVCERILNKNYTLKSIREKAEEDVLDIKEGNYLNKIDKYFDCFYEQTSTLMDFLNENYIVFIDEISKIKNRADNIAKDNDELIRDIISKKKLPPSSLINQDDYIKFNNYLQNKQVIYMEKQDNGYVDKQSMHAKRNGYSFSYREVNFFRSSMDLLLKELQEEKRRGKSIIILGGNPENSKKISNLLLENQILNDYTEKIDDLELAPSSIVVTTGALSAGFVLGEINLMVISLAEFFVTKPKKLRTNKSFKDAEKVVIADLKEGDIVVHRVNGIGQYLGVNTIDAAGVIKDYIKIKYRNNDILYVPTESLDNIRKYIGGDISSTRLSKLGTKEWDKTKEKVKNSLREVAENLIQLYAKRQKMEGFSFSKDTPWQKEFEDLFPFVETDDQLRCIDEIKKDMEKNKPMDRLLCGDVGYGKTEVAIRAAFKAVMDQKQVVYLAPTTILSQQQYEEFAERMKDFPINIAILNRFKTKKEQDEIVRKIKTGEIDIIIGTHRVLSKDVVFNNLGLLIIDEEHRFGVKSKEKIKELKNNIDVLTMTATPIPRTLHMSIVGMRDMSVIYEPPHDRKPVQTYVLEYDNDVIKEAITKELERDGQVFYLFNNVQNIQKKQLEIQQLVPEAKVEIAHGKMSGSEIETIMEDFINKKINVLICTTILESGIDIPNANTIIVENAERLGLAQLYQIRGRVGRSNKQAYAYITYKKDKVLSEDSDKRLKAIKEFTEFGSGFRVAMRDLEIRGAGSVLGEVQHGHFEQVGFDMYNELLNETIKELRGEKVEEEIDVQLEINVSSYIPDDYIDNSSIKISIYQDIAYCTSDEDIQNVTDEIIDRFGTFPPEVENLLKVAKIKVLCREKNIYKISERNSGILFFFDKEKFNIEIIDKLMKKYRNKIKFSPSQQMPYITLSGVDENNKLQHIKEFLQEL